MELTPVASTTVIGQIWVVTALTPVYDRRQVSKEEKWPSNTYHQ